MLEIHNLMDAQIERSSQGAVKATRNPLAYLKWKARGPFVYITGALDAWGLRVCVVPSRVDPKPTPDAAASTKEEAEAFARLIAAAPDLLEALTEAAETHAQYLAAIPPRYSDHSGDIPRERALQDKMRAAIAKAERGQS